MSHRPAVLAQVVVATLLAATSLGSTGAATAAAPAERVVLDPMPRSDVAVSSDESGGLAPMAPWDDTFDLSSRPGAPVTVYLDFRGGSVTDSVWNARYGDRITVAPYSTSSDPSFSPAELATVQHVWAIVAEDYAPFDVDVTTRWPGQAALTRSGPDDDAFGAHVHVTDAGPVYDDCRCAGAAYVGKLGATSRQAYFNDVFAFADGVGHTTKSLGEVVSHEVGHAFGLTHDSTASEEYYAGSSPWSPVMGVGYAQPVTQWSQGEYDGATNQQDDVAIIAGVAGLADDDHAEAPRAATPLTIGEPTAGVIESRDDVDAFSFTGAGRLSVSVEVPPYANLDAQLTILDEHGDVVARVDPAVVRTSSSTATGLGATWTGTLPAGGATWTAVVDGVGHAPAYSDYGSLGRYQIWFSAAEMAEMSRPLSFTTGSALHAGKVGRHYASTVRASGGHGDLTVRAVSGWLPPGLRLTTSTTGVARISGTPKRAAKRTVVLRVTDTDGHTARRSFTIRVR